LEYLGEGLGAKRGIVRKSVGRSAHKGAHLRGEINAQGGWGGVERGE